MTVRRYISHLVLQILTFTLLAHPWSQHLTLLLPWLPNFTKKTLNSLLSGPSSSCNVDFYSQCSLGIELCKVPIALLTRKFNSGLFLKGSESMTLPSSLKFSLLLALKEFQTQHTLWHIGIILSWREKDSKCKKDILTFLNTGDKLPFERCSPCTWRKEDLLIIRYGESRVREICSNRTCYTN